MPLLTFPNQCHSWGSKGLRQATTTLQKSCPWKIGNGSHIGVLKDHWVKGHVPLLRDHVPLRLASTLRVQDFILENNGGWNVFKVYQFFTPASARCILAL